MTLHLKHCTNSITIHALTCKSCLPLHVSVPIAVAVRSKAWVCGRSPAEIVGSNPTGGTDVCCDCCVVSGRGLCDELITRPEESYRLWCVVVCGLKTSCKRRPWPRGVVAPKTNKHVSVMNWSSSGRKFYRFISVTAKALHCKYITRVHKVCTRRCSSCTRNCYIMPFGFRAEHNDKSSVTTFP